MDKCTNCNKVLEDFNVIECRVCTDPLCPHCVSGQDKDLCFNCAEVMRERIEVEDVEHGNDEGAI